MKNIRFFLAILFVAQTIIVSSQSYIATDSAVSYGAQILDRGSDNYRFCTVLEHGKQYKYNPYEVKKYMIRGGKTYTSIAIESSDTIRKVFALRIVSGNMSIYQYNYKGEKLFFLEDNIDMYTPLPMIDEDGNSYIDILKSKINKENYAYEYIDLLDYSRASFINYFERYNSQKEIHLTVFHYGFSTGFDFASLKGSETFLIQNYYPFEPKFNSSLFLGAFCDIPIFLQGLYLHPELNFSRHGFSFNAHEEYREIDFLANFYSIRMPILVKYELPIKKFRPYLNGGIEFAFNYVKDDLFLYSSVYDGTIYVEREFPDGLVDEFQLGISTGLGLNYTFSPHYSGFVELRYSHQVGGVNSSGIQLNVFKIAIGVSI